jgi:hypothetical protein
MNQMLKAHDVGDGAFNVARVKVDQGELVRVSLRSLPGVIGIARCVGSAFTQSLQSTSNVTLAQIPGGAGGASPSHAMETLQSISGCQVRFFGRRVGVQVAAQYNADPIISVLVNRELVFSGNVGPRLDSLLMPSSASDNDPNHMIPCAADLIDDGPHTLTFLIHPDPAVSTSLTAVALLLERRLGYRDEERASNQIAAATLTTSPTNISTGQHGTLHRVHYTNSDTAAAHVVQVTNADGTYATFSVPIAPATPAAAVGTYDLIVNDALPAAVFPTWKHFADAGAFVKATAIVGI